MDRKTFKPEIVGQKPEFKLPTSAIRYAVIGILLFIVLVWIGRGGPAYTVSAGEEGVVLTFGKYTSTTEAGFHLKWPWPVQTVEVVNVREIRRLEIGFRSTEYAGSTTYRSFMQDKSLLEEAQMLTGDENVVDCSMAVQYRITDSRDFLFNFREGDVKYMLQAIAEAALRQAVGDHPINDVLTTGKFAIMGEIKQKMQELADLTGAGVTIQDVFLQDVQPPREVAAAFKDVASAREERERIINEAQAYQSSNIPMAQGEAERIRLDAAGYKEARVAEAQGSVARFKAIADQYNQAPEITRARLYLEAMSNLLPKVRITVVDDKVGVVNVKSVGASGGAPMPVPVPQEQGGSQ